MRVLWRVVAGIVVLAVLLLAGYAFAARRLLSGPWLRSQINLNPEEMLIDWDAATSTWPGRVAVRNLRIRGSDSNVQWIVTIPEGTLRYSLLALVQRTFRVTELRPRSIQFHLRQKVPPGKARSPRLKFLPPIPGFSDPPLREGGALGPPPSNPWTVHLIDVTTDALDDVWVDGLRYRGPATLHGGFRLKPGHRARIGPASVDFRGGRLEVDETPAVTELKGRVEATFEDWNVQELTENKVWRVVTASVVLAGPTPGVDSFDIPLKLGERVHVSGGPGRFALSGKIDRGKAEGVVELTAKNGKYTRPEFVLEGSAEARLRLSNWVLDGGEPEIGGSTLKVTDVFVAGGRGRTRDWWGDFEVRSGRLPKGFAGKVAVKCRDARPLIAFLDDALPKWTGDLVKLEGLTATAELVLSEPRTTVRGLEAKGGKFTIEGDYERRGHRSRGAFFIEGGILDVAVGLEDGRAKLHLFGPRKWFEKERDLAVAQR